MYIHKQHQFKTQNPPQRQSATSAGADKYYDTIISNSSPSVTDSYILENHIFKFKGYCKCGIIQTINTLFFC